MQLKIIKNKKKYRYIECRGNLNSIYRIDNGILYTVV